MTAAEFERDYAARSNVTVADLREWGQVAIRCDCGERGCKGWAMVRAGKLTETEVPK